MIQRILYTFAAASLYAENRYPLFRALLRARLRFLPAKGIDMTVRWPFVIGTSLLILNEVRGVAVVAMVLLGIGHV